MIKHPWALTLAHQHTANQWMVGDQLVADLGKPPKSFAACVRQIEAAFPDIDDEAKQLAQLWRAADAFPVGERMDVGIEAHIAAGTLPVLQAAMMIWHQDKSVKLMEHIKLVKRGFAMEGDEEGFWRKRREKAR